MIPAMRADVAQQPVGGGLLRRLPHNVDAEIAVLACLVTYPSSADRLLAILTPECFCEDPRRRIFEAIVARRQRGEAADAIGLADFAASDEIIVQAGGRAFIEQIADCDCGPLNAEQYAYLLGDLHRRRELIEVAGDVIKQAYDAGTDLAA